MKKFQKKFIPKNRFARSVSLLAGGTIAGQGIIVLSSPILTRLYTPEDFGLVAVFASLLGILAVVASLRYQLAIPLPEEDDEAVNVAVLSFIVVLAMTILSFILVVFFRNSIAELLNARELAGYLWLIPIGLMLTGIYQVLNYWALRTKAFSAIARTRLTQSVGMSLVQICGYTIGPLALLLGRVVGQAAGVTTLCKHFPRILWSRAASYDGQHSDEQSHGEHQAVCESNRVTVMVNFSSIKKQALNYRGFPLISTWTGLSSAAGSHLTPLLIVTIFGGAAAGFFALTHRVMAMPMALVGTAMGDVFYREAAEAHRKGCLDQLVITINERLISLAMPLALFFALIAPELFSLVFGAEWLIAGVLAQCITVWMFFQFITSPATRIYPILGRHKSALAFQSSLAVSSAASISIGGLYFESLVASVLFLSLSNSLIYFVRLLTSVRLAGGSVASPLKNLARYAVLSVLYCLPLLVYYTIFHKLECGGNFQILAVLLSGILVIASTYRSVRVFLYE